MISYVVGFALLLHVSFWGAGLAAMIMPRPWRRFWPVLMLPAGVALQSLVVWFGAYANLRGTSSYALPAEIIPVALLVVAFSSRGWRRAGADLGRFGLVWLAVAGSLALLILPLAIASRGLTTVSLGSCDAADYAAGARVLAEFAHSDRTGFLGLTEVVKVMSADNFFDFWLRLNHFTPSAVIALNGSILHCAAHELASLLTAMVLAASVPVVFWVARALFGYSGVASLAVATLYALSPVTWYSYAQVSPAPLIAAQAIALLTWAGIALWNGRLTWRRGGQFAAALAVAYALVLGGYNFIVLVAFVPAVAYVGARTLWAGGWAKLVRWVLVMLAPLVGCGLVFWGRVDGLVERFMLFQTYDFGWRIPALTPEGWMGMVRGGDLRAWPWGLRALLALVIAGALAWSVQAALARRRRRVWLLASVTVPVLLGYAYLEWRGARMGTNASYDAFKLFSVFFPLMLPAFCWWITLRWSLRLTQWFAVVGLAVVVFGFNLVACAMGIVALSRPSLIVDGELRQVRRIERMPDVGSVNLLIPDMWPRLWANYFLLRKPQCFLTHTYEGRLNTPLRGEWDLASGVVRAQPAGAGSRDITAHYRLVDTRAPGFVRPLPTDGWYPEEHLANGERWRWTRGDARVQVDNPAREPVSVVLSLDGRSLGERDLTVGVEGRPMPSDYVHLGDQRRTVKLPAVTIPAGRSVLVLHSKQLPSHPSGDMRPLAVCVFGLNIQPAPAP